MEGGDGRGRGGEERGGEGRGGEGEGMGDLFRHIDDMIRHIVQCSPLRVLHRP